MTKSITSFNVRRYINGLWSAEAGITPCETAVTLTINGEQWLDFMCTPENLEALAVGFLYNEGLIDSIADVEQVRVCEAGDNVDVWTAHPVEKPANWRRTSGCAGGVTSAGSEPEQHTLERPFPPRGKPVPPETFFLTPTKINGLVVALFEAQELHRQSGGVHASAVSDGEKLLLSCEDIGRHNTLDKLSGRILLEAKEVSLRVVLTTGRISSEMLQKSARMGMPVIISCTSPTSMAVQLAEAWGMTLIGYARSGRFTIYSHSERIEEL
jgi:FdhD protein